MRSALVHLIGAVVLSSGLGAARLVAQQPAGASSAPRYADVSVGLRFGTPGIGLEVGKLLTGHLSARIAGYYFKVNSTQTQSDVTYNATLKLHAFTALLDLYPFSRGGFHLTAGVATNPLTITGTGQPTGSSYTINGTTYTASQVGTLTADGKFPGVSPYLGLGFGTPARRGGGLEFLFDLGATIGKPTFSLNATGPAASNPTFMADLQAQRDKTQSDVNKYLRAYPVLNFGLAYRF
jgi:hypothetical protein